MVECHPISVRDQSRLHQSGKKVLPRNLSWVCIDRGRIWKGDYSDCGFGRFGKSWMHQKFILEDWTRKMYWYHKKEMSSYSQQQMVQQKCQEETTNSENPLWDGNKPKGARTSVENFKVNLEESQPTESKDVAGDFICRHHTEPRVQLYVPKEEKFTIPLKYIDVTRSTHTDLDVMQEKRIDDRWNVDSKRNLSDSWRGFTKFALLKEKPSKGHVVRRETDKSSNDYQARSRVASSMDEHWWSPPRIKKHKNWKMGSPNSIMLEDWEEFTLSILMTKITKTLSKKCEEKIGKTHGSSHVVQGKVGLAPRRWLRSRKLHTKRFSKRFMVV